MSKKTQKNGTGTGIVPVVGKNIVALPELKNLFYESMIKGIDSWNILSKLGRSNVKKLLSYARNSEGSCSGRIKELYKKRETLNGVSREDFIKNSEEYDGLPNPFPQKGERPNNWSGNLEPIGAEAETRKHDSSTYTICGWCKHSSGIGRFQYTISGSCDFYREQPDVACHSVEWDTPCFMRTLGKEDFKTMVKNIDLKIEEEKAKREGIRSAISFMQDLLKTIKDDKPYLMSLRPHDYFNVGDRLRVYIGNFPEKIVDGDWITASCIWGYRHHDGCISYQSDFPIHTNLSYLEGRGSGAGSSRPEVMKESDFEYFTKSKDDIFINIWINNISERLKEYSTEKERNSFKEKLINPNIAEPPKNWKLPSNEIEVLTVKNALDVLMMSTEPKTKKDLNNWVKFQLKYVHPDKFSKDDKVMQEYSHRQTRAIYAARDILLAKLKTKK